jgi:hypothetical protein
MAAGTEEMRIVESASLLSHPLCQLVLIANDDLIAGILNRNGLVTGPHRDSDDH